MTGSFPHLQKCWFLAGPTACGKSATALRLAEQIDAEIIALDSMSLYRGMDIGTAKPSPADRQKIPHHLIDVLAPHEEYSVAEYLAAAERCVKQIVERGHIPLFVGGTGLYLRSILRGVFEGPPANWEFRRALEARAASHPPSYLHDRLREVDPLSAEKLHPNDRRRIVRALEVHQLTGQPLSALQVEQPLPLDQRPPHVYWLDPPRDWLRKRIDQRVEQMLADGWLDEVRSLISKEPPPGRTARQALGYQELIRHLNGQIGFDEAVEQIQTRTRQFAKRQHTWFRNLVECEPIPVNVDDDPESLTKRILQTAESCGLDEVETNEDFNPL